MKTIDDQYESKNSLNIRFTELKRMDSLTSGTNMLK